MTASNTHTSLTRKLATLSTGALLLAATGSLAHADEYEWDPTWGYHEEEWYDPSDWFDSEAGINYEDTWTEYGYGYGPYDYYEPYDYWTYGYDTYDVYDTFDYDYDYDYATQDDSLAVADYAFDQEIEGTVKGMKRVQGVLAGEPSSVVLEIETRDGQTREVKLGDVGYSRGLGSKFKAGQQIAIGGEMIERNGQRMLKAQEIRTQDSVYDIPEYAYNRTIRGKLVGMKKVSVRNGDVEMLVGKIEDPRGETRTVILGKAEDLDSQAKTIKPDSQVTINGYRREVNGESTFVVQSVEIGQPDPNADQRQNRDTQRAANGSERSGQSEQSGQTDRRNSSETRSTSAERQ